MSASTLKKNQILMSVIVVVFCLPVMIGAAKVYQNHRWAQAKIEEIEPRYARFLGLQASAQNLEQKQKQAEGLLHSYVYPASLDVTQAGNDAQQRVRDIFTKSKLDVMSSQVLTSKLDKRFDRVPLLVRLEGDLVSLQSALTVLESQKPMILVDGMTIQTLGAIKPEVAQRLSIQFNLSVLREHP